MRRAYDAEVARRYVLAETATHGHVLSEEGEARGVGPRSLFSDPAWRVDRFGSGELREWFAEHGRITLADWRAMTSTGVAEVPAAVRVPTVDQVAAVVDGPAELPADVAEPVAAAVVGVEDAEPVCEAAPAPVPQRVRAVVPVDQTAAVAAPVKAPAVPYWVLPAPPPMPEAANEVLAEVQQDQPQPGILRRGAATIRGFLFPIAKEAATEEVRELAQQGIDQIGAAVSWLM